jgi:hypothetical protein
MIYCFTYISNLSAACTLGSHEVLNGHSFETTIVNGEACRFYEELLRIYLKDVSENRTDNGRFSDWELGENETKLLL